MSVNSVVMPTFDPKVYIICFMIYLATQSVQKKQKTNNLLWVKVGSGRGAVGHIWTLSKIQYLLLINRPLGGFRHRFAFFTSLYVCAIAKHHFRSCRLFFLTSFLPYWPFVFIVYRFFIFANRWPGLTRLSQTWQGFSSLSQAWTGMNKLAWRFGLYLVKEGALRGSWGVLDVVSTRPMFKLTPLPWFVLLGPYFCWLC